MAKVTFRAATERDLPQMARLFTKRVASERQAAMRARWRKEPTGWQVAVVDDQVLGCCQVVFPRRGDAWLQWMRIAPDAQGSGIGGAFSDYLERQAVLGGAQAVRLNTMTTNERVHYMMGGLRGYTEWARWSRLTGLRAAPAREWLDLCTVRRANAEELADVERWLERQVGHQRAFAAVTCPTDFRKTVSLDRTLLHELQASKGRQGLLIAEQQGEIAAVACYAVQGGELRVLQLVASTTAGGLAACAAALGQARRGEAVSVQTAGLVPDLLKTLYRSLRSKNGRQHDFYVFGKRF